MNVSIPLALASFFAATPLHAEPTNAGDQVGKAYEITLVRDSSSEGTDGSSSSSHDSDAIIERVMEIRTDGLEVEYDLPKDATAEDRVNQWQFPARIFMPYEGSPQLLNRPELEARVDAWLKAARWPHAVCGHWIFTWNAFRIECDPQSVIDSIAPFNLRSVEAKDGEAYREKGTLGPVPLKRTASAPSGATFVAVLQVDPEAVRHSRAETDVAVGEMLQKAITLEAALQKRSKEDVAGSITVTLQTDAEGNVWRRTKLMKLRTKSPDGQWKDETVTETVERQPISRLSS